MFKKTINVSTYHCPIQTQNVINFSRQIGVAYLKSRKLSSLLQTNSRRIFSFLQTHLLLQNVINTFRYIRFRLLFNAQDNLFHILLTSVFRYNFHSRLVVVSQISSRIPTYDLFFNRISLYLTTLISLAVDRIILSFVLVQI